MRTLTCIAAIWVLGFYSVVHPPKGIQLPQPPQQISQPQPDVFRVQVTPRLIVIRIAGDVKIRNLAPKCSLYYGLEGEPLKVGEGIAQVDQNEVKPMAEKTIRTNEVLSLICAPGQAFPIEIQKLSE